jgi:hypothetical protein
MTFKDSLEKEIKRFGLEAFKANTEFPYYPDRCVASILALIEAELPKELKVPDSLSYEDAYEAKGWMDCLSEMRKKMKGK